MNLICRTGRASRGDDVYLYFVLACAITWTMASPAALAWMRHRSPVPLAVAGAGLSAFGPLLAALVVAGRKRELRQVFGRWRTRPGWVPLALLATPLVHLIATALFVAIGGHPDRWFHPPNTPEAAAALVVFPLGEEFGWRGFAHPRMVSRYGAVRGALILGVVWGLWHLMYTITPTASGFDPFELAMIMTELPFYSLLIAWVFERADRSMAVALAFHAGAHLDHIERAPRSDPRLHLLHLAVLAVAAGAAGWSLAYRSTNLRSRSSAASHSAET
jgi:membrane protease YdiL (CAAX protease family)